MSDNAVFWLLFALIQVVLISAAFGRQWWMNSLTRPAWPISKEKALRIMRVVAITFICIEIFVFVILAFEGKL